MQKRLINITIKSLQTKNADADAVLSKLQEIVVSAKSSGFKNIRIFPSTEQNYEQTYGYFWITGDRLETDKEFQFRCDLVERNKKDRYKNYLKLKEEFESEI